MHKVKKGTRQADIPSDPTFRKCSAANCSSATALSKPALQLATAPTSRKRTRPIKKKPKPKTQSNTSHLLTGLKGKKAAAVGSATERCLRSVGDSLLTSPQRMSLDPAGRQRSWDIVPTPQIYPHHTVIPVSAPVDYYGLSERKTLDSQHFSDKSPEQIISNTPSDVREELERLQYHSLRSQSSHLTAQIHAQASEEACFDQELQTLKAKVRSLTPKTQRLPLSPRVALVTQKGNFGACEYCSFLLSKGYSTSHCRFHGCKVPRIPVSSKRSP